MHAFSSSVQRTCLSAVLAIFSFQAGAKIARSRVPQQKETSNPNRHLRLVASTDCKKYSLGDSLRLSALLENIGDEPVYVDRRMYWTGLSGGLKLVISDEQGNFLPAQLFSDAMMPPPKESDTSILILLNGGFLYGTSVHLGVKSFFPKPGRYSLRVLYKSMLPKEMVAPQLRGLPALWSDTPAIPSEPIWITITQ